jgi:hypothetical protein
MAMQSAPTFQQPVSNPTLPIGVPSEQYILGKNSHNSITVPLVENLLGGLGTAVFFFCLALAAHALTMRFFNYPVIEHVGAVLIFCAALGGITFGVMSIIHFFSDEIRKLYGIASVKKLDKERNDLLEANKAFIARVRELEDKLAISGRYSALALAERLLREYFHYHKPLTRDASLERGWTRNDWNLAYNHLKNAEVVDGRGQLRVESFELGMAKALQATQGQGKWVRAADGDWAKVGNNVPTDDSPDDELPVEKPQPVRQYDTAPPKSRGRPPKATIAAERAFPSAELGL